MSHPESGVDVVNRRVPKLKMLIASLCCALGLATIGAATASAATLQVATTGNDSGNCVASACLTVQYAIGQATEDDVVSVGAGTFDGAFTINKRLTIEGAGDTTVLTAPSSPVANVGTGASGSEIEDVLFQGVGSPTTTASAIRTDVATTGVKITDVEVTGFSSYAVAIHNNGFITDWVIDGLNTHGNLHGMRVRGQAQNLSIDNSHFDDNTSHGFFAVESGTLDGITVTDSTFSGNGDKAFYLERGNNISLERVTANDTGGHTHPSPNAIEFNLKNGATAGPVAVVDSTIDNTVGAGIVVRGGVESPTVSGATLTGNTVSDSLVAIGFENKVDLSGVTVDGNVLTGSTAAIANAVESGVLILGRTNQFSGNEADIDGPGITAIPPTITAPVLSGTGEAGSALTCTPGSATGYPASGIAIEWLVDGVAVSGQNGNDFTPAQGEVGRSITCRTTVSNPGGTADALSNGIVVTEAPPATPVSKPPVVAPVKQQITVPKNGTVVVATIECPTGTCKIDAPKKVKVKIGGKVYLATVKVQKTVGEGKEAKVRLVLPKKAQNALKGKGTKAKVKITVTSSDGKKRVVNQNVKLKGKRK